MSDLDFMLALHLPPFASKTPKIAPVLQLLLPEDTAGIIQEQEDDAMEGEPLKLTTEISISAAQMRSFLKFDTAAASPLQKAARATKRNARAML